MRYKIGDKVVVARRSRLGFWWWILFLIPWRGLPVADPSDVGRVIEVIEPSESRSVKNVGGYKVEFGGSRTHYYRDEDLRPAE